MSFWGSENHPYADDLVACKRLVRKPWTCRVYYIPREANGTADALAKIGHHLNDNSEFF